MTTTTLFTVELNEPAGISRWNEPVRFSVPVKRGALFDSNGLRLLDNDGKSLPLQTSVLMRWPDTSVKWLQIYTALDLGAGSTECLRGTAVDGPAATAGHDMPLTRGAGGWMVDPGTAAFQAYDHGSTLFRVLRPAVNAENGGDLVGLRLLSGDGSSHAGEIAVAKVEEHGALRTVLRFDGSFPTAGTRLPLQFSARVGFFSGRGDIAIDVSVANPRAARHPANLWDLGDRNACRFRELAVTLAFAEDVAACTWQGRPDDAPRVESRLPWCIYQDSSGGSNWNSPNHIDAAGKAAVRFRGYRTFAGSADVPDCEGFRAQPIVKASADTYSCAVSIADFWQNFPTAIRIDGSSMTLALFPREAAGPHELQAGERKRHLLWIAAHADDPMTRIRSLLSPIQVNPDRSAVRESGTIPYLADIPENSDRRQYVDEIISGNDSFFAKREIIDEFGWRNFGDLYADHESVGRAADRPLVSHYNNQYDFIFGACVHYWRTGDDRWRQLMVELSRHVVDIDIYHTQEDRPAYNGGLFWHTDHHCDAATATHRTFSRANYRAGYGGGPSNEHNYTTGLLHYFLFSGDRAAHEAVLKLADWVIAMDDGSRTLYSIVNARPTGLASRTVSSDYHGPGRGAGNSINALLDAYALSGVRRYMSKAEELLLRCIHPADDIGSLNLDRPEHRWSYLVFLQVLGKYLDAKGEMGEFDYFFHYARASLLHYSDWMLQNECPYKEVLDRVELPTETWPAQDIRKCHIMHLAARHCCDNRQSAFTDKATYFHDRCIDDLLSFESAGFTRPRVIIAVYGHVHDYYRQNGYAGDGQYRYDTRHNYDFGMPSEFVPQRALLWAGIRSGIRVILAEAARVSRDALAKARLRRRSSERQARRS